MTSISRRPSVLVATAAALALGTGLLPMVATSARASDAVATTAAPREQGPSYDVTLITGDRVHFTDLPGNQDVVTVDPAVGAAGSVHVQTYGTATYVIPDEALPLLAAGHLDQRLFNITELVAMGYDDARSAGIPLIATAPRTRSAKAPVVPDGGTKVRELRSIRATAMKADKKRARIFWEDVTSGTSIPKSLTGGTAKLWLDGRVGVALSESVPQIGAPEAWAEGYDGEGVKVAVLDTGIDAGHPDFKNRIAGSKSFIPGEEVDDRHGHGTHVASTIAGSGAASGGAKRGVAPSADLYVGKVLADGGSGVDSGVIEGMEWAKAQGVDVVSMSLGGGFGSDGDDPMSQAVDALSAGGGPLFVVAAGNASGVGTIGAPGASRSALTVAAVDKTDKRASFSSQGPLVNSYGLKPDISPPGVDISAAASQLVPGVADMYRSMSGTSMATPHVAGVAAILKQAHPDWDGARVKDALMTTSKKLNAYKPYSMGTGRVDAAAAVGSSVEATGSVPAAVFKWPHVATETAHRTITYRNTGATDVTLNLSTDTLDPAYHLSVSSLTVRPGGTANATLTLDPSTVPNNTTFSGQVIAADATTGKVVAHTGFALFKERELYDYTIRLTGRDGKPAADTVMISFRGALQPLPVAVEGERTLRLPPNTYTAWSYVDVPGDTADSLGFAQLTDPETILRDGPATVHLDATSVRRIDSVPQREAETTQTILDYRRTFTDGSGTHGRTFSNAVVLSPRYDAVYVQPTTPVTDGNLSLLTHTKLREKFLDAETGTGRNIALSPQYGTAYHEGRRLLRTVYAGNGSAADFADLNAKGKAVIVDRSAVVTGETRAKAAVDAGAAMLITVNNAPGRLFEYFGENPGLGIATAGRLDGERLIAEAKAGDGTLNIQEKRYPDYRYNLVQGFDGIIPDRPLTYSPGHDDLARIDTSVYGRKGQVSFGTRHFIPSWGPGVGLYEYDKSPGTVTEYVTPQPDGLGFWYEEHSVDRNGDVSLAATSERSPHLYYEGGTLYKQHWFKPVQAPRLGSGFWEPFRNGNTLQWNIPAWSGSGAGHTASGYNPYDGSIASQLYQGDRLLRSVNGQSGVVTSLPAESSPYRLVLEASRDRTAFPTSTRTRTEWGFVSGHQPTGKSPIDLLNPVYEVDTDLHGNVRAGHKIELGLGAATYPKGVEATGAALQVSYDDGETWRPATLQKTAGGRWKTVLNTPSDPSVYVSLRMTADGPDGLTVTQEVIRAFGTK
ncbi:S8 family serine peptidase [Streptomyces sp. NPDC002825]|uniref:S8 family serine peptidase n=1 Tax=Streptomyces sp. NPDC002825 TaxID=3154666 RepID=UPI003333AD45